MSSFIFKHRIYRLLYVQVLGEVYEEYTPLRTVSNGGKARSSRGDRANARRKLRRTKMGRRCERPGHPQTDDKTVLQDCSLPGGGSVAACGSGAGNPDSLSTVDNASSSSSSTGCSGSIVPPERPFCTERHPVGDLKGSPPTRGETRLHGGSSGNPKADTNRVEINEPVASDQIAPGDCRPRQQIPASEGGDDAGRVVDRGGRVQRLSRSVKQLFVRGDNVVLITPVAAVPAPQEAASGDM